MNIVTKIYGLVNPVSGEIFYIGCTRKTLASRLECHKRSSRRSKSPKARYIKWIQWMGLQPDIVELDCLVNASIADIKAKEQAYIDFYGLTRPLTNSIQSGYWGNDSSVQIEWTFELISKLGVIADRTLAKQLNCCKTTICRKREELGIAACEHPHKIDWTDELLSRLGTVPDTQIARELNCDKRSVQNMRKSLGIKPYKPFRKIVWTDDIVDQLGKLPDWEIAKAIGCDVKTVCKYRNRLGIAACGPRPELRNNPQGWNKINLPDSIIKKLGTMSDRKLAKIANVSAGLIRNTRLKLDIPCYGYGLRNAV